MIQYTRIPTQLARILTQLARILTQLAVYSSQPLQVPDLASTITTGPTSYLSG